jgi:hypothetical protein
MLLQYTRQFLKCATRSAYGAHLERSFEGYLAIPDLAAWMMGEILPQFETTATCLPPSNRGATQPSSEIADYLAPRD